MCHNNKFTNLIIYLLVIGGVRTAQHVEGDAEKRNKCFFTLILNNNRDSYIGMKLWAMRKCSKN